MLASLDGQLYNRLDSFNRLIVEHDAEYEMLSTTHVGEEQAGHRRGCNRLCDLAFTFYEQIFKHHFRYDLLDTEDWESGGKPWSTSSAKCTFAATGRPAASAMPQSSATSPTRWPWHHRRLD